MGVGLYFRTAGPVAPDVETAVRADLAAEDRQPWILCEPIHFFSTEDRVLAGGSKLNLIPNPDELAELLDDPPERSDLRAVLHSLADWSTRFDLTWELDIDAAPFGRIEPGDGPEGLADKFDAMAELASELGSLDLSDWDEGPDPSVEEENRDDPPTGPRLFRG